jgi:hypothetical protein
VEWAQTLDGALSRVFGDGAAGDGEETPEDPTGGTVEELLDQAAAAFVRADEALTAGDLAEYQRWVDEAESLLEEARALINDSVEALISSGL